MLVEEIVSALPLTVGAGANQLDKKITGGYASDLLSMVMANAQAGNVWVTLQAHVNIVAVAALLDLACIIISQGAQPDAETLARANEKGIPILLAQEGTFAVVGALSRLGIAESGSGV